MSALAIHDVTFDHDTNLRRLASCRRDRVRFVDIPETRYLAVNGTAEPGSEAFQAAVGALYRIAYPLHFMLRGRGVRGHRVGMLEALYWLPPRILLNAGTTSADRVHDWRWRLIIAIPAEATDDEVAETIRRGSDGVSDVFVDHWREGPSAQILHVGPYEAEGPTLRRLHEGIAAGAMRPRGAHHEIYLNDPYRVGPDRIRTVLRQPVTR